MKSVRTVERLIGVLRSTECLYINELGFSFSPDTFFGKCRKAETHDIVRLADSINVERNKDGNILRADIRISVENGSAIIDALGHSIFFVGYRELDKVYYNETDDVIGLFKELKTYSWRDA